ncbi:MAG: hypothetical protein IPK19_07795 [Chloroflexi bacterium]|nr:hypothetical protein [Chloroflexota bacterium]
MTLSRREFLRVLGVSAAVGTSSAIPLAPSQAVVPPALNDVVRARALHTAAIRDLPSPEAPIIDQFWEDEIFEIQAVEGRWLRSSKGFVSASDVQPMVTPVQSVVSEQKSPVWAEVIAASAPVRQWSADNAPSVAKIGHGGVMRIMDRLTPQAGNPAWVGIADEHHHLVGWSRAELWSAIDWRDQRDLDLMVVRETGRAVLVRSGQALIQVDAALGPQAAPGVYPITRILPGQTQQVAGVKRYGVPYVQESGNVLCLGGVYWHNRVGAIDQGMHLQLPVHIARAWFGRLRRVTIL